MEAYHKSILVLLIVEADFFCGLNLDQIIFTGFSSQLNYIFRFSTEYYITGA